MKKKCLHVFHLGERDWFLKLKLEARRGKKVTTSFFLNQKMYSAAKLTELKSLFDSSSSCSFSPNTRPFSQLDSTGLGEEKLLGSRCRCQPVQPLLGSKGKRKAPASPADRLEAMWRILHWHPLTALSWAPSWNACQVVSSKKIYAQEQESNAFPPAANRAAHASLKRQTRSPWLIPKTWMWLSELLILSARLPWPKTRQRGGLDKSQEQHQPRDVRSVCSTHPLFSLPAHKMLGWGKDAVIWQLHKEHNC